MVYLYACWNQLSAVSKFEFFGAMETLPVLGRSVGTMRLFLLDTNFNDSRIFNGNSHVFATDTWVLTRSSALH